MRARLYVSEVMSSALIVILLWVDRLIRLACQWLMLSLWKRFYVYLAYNQIYVYERDPCR